MWSGGGRPAAPGMDELPREHRAKGFASRSRSCVKPAVDRIRHPGRGHYQACLALLRTLSQLRSRRFQRLLRFRISLAAWGQPLHGRPCRHRPSARFGDGYISQATDPPTFLLMFEPLTLMPIHESYWVWQAINLAAFIVALVLLFAPRFSGLPRPLAMTLTGLAMVYAPVGTISDRAEQDPSAPVAGRDVPMHGAEVRRLGGNLPRDRRVDASVSPAVDLLPGLAQPMARPWLPDGRLDRRRDDHPGLSWESGTGSGS